MSLADRPFQGRRVPGWLASLAVVGSYATIAALGRRSPVRKPRIKRRPEGLTAWKQVLLRTYEEINNDRLLAIAAGVVFYALLALFPAITALVSCYALFAKASTINAHLALVSSLMPASAYQIVDEQVTRIVMRGTGDLGTTFFIGLALAVWSANAGVKAVIDALNICYGVKERRGFFKLNAVSLLFTVGAIATLLMAIAAVIVLPLVMSFLHAGHYGDLAAGWLRWPALLLLLLLGLATLYRFGPDVEGARWRWISPGAAFAAVAWVGGSALLSWYLASFADYDKTYGSLGAGIGLMMWLWMTAIVVLVGAELNSEIDAENSPRDEKSTAF